jgi:hypothetical protein
LTTEYKWIEVMRHLETQIRQELKRGSRSRKQRTKDKCNSGNMINKWSRLTKEYKYAQGKMLLVRMKKPG